MSKHEELIERLDRRAQCRPGQHPQCDDMREAARQALNTKESEAAQ